MKRYQAIGGTKTPDNSPFVILCFLSNARIPVESAWKRYCRIIFRRNMSQRLGVPAGVAHSNELSETSRDLHSITRRAERVWATFLTAFSRVCLRLEVDLHKRRRPKSERNQPYRA